MIAALFDKVLARYGPLRREWPLRYWPMVLLTWWPVYRSRWQGELAEHREWQAMAAQCEVKGIEVGAGLMARLKQIPEQEAQQALAGETPLLLQEAFWWPRASAAVAAAMVCGLLLGMNAELSMNTEFSEESLAYLDITGTPELSTWLSGEEL